MSEFVPYNITPGAGGGRLPYDFEITTRNHVLRLDFKFNVQNIKSYPQIIDIKSDRLGDFCYATYYYNYSGIKEKNISLKNYLKYIWQSNADTKDAFFSNLKRMYKTDLEFKKKQKLVFEKALNLILS